MIKDKQIAHMFALIIKEVPKLNFYAEEWGFCLKKLSSSLLPFQAGYVSANPQPDKNYPYSLPNETGRSSDLSYLRPIFTRQGEVLVILHNYSL
ncbi:hypothetical protein [Zobellella sp. An-6]|uniref:hypothetical protein n=1 Tax=Zobellella sp. An-6 TaxID=3400218 RepID=UPI004041819A